MRWGWVGWGTDWCFRKASRCGHQHQACSQALPRCPGSCVAVVLGCSHSLGDICGRHSHSSHSQPGLAPCSRPPKTRAPKALHRAASLLRAAGPLGTQLPLCVCPARPALGSTENAGSFSVCQPLPRCTWQEAAGTTRDYMATTTPPLTPETGRSKSPGFSWGPAQAASCPCPWQCKCQACEAARNGGVGPCLCPSLLPSAPKLQLVSITGLQRSVPLGGVQAPSGGRGGAAQAHPGWGPGPTHREGPAISWGLIQTHIRSASKEGSSHGRHVET